MSDERAHLTDGEKLELARGGMEHGPSVEHLDRCEACSADVERLCAAEENAVYARAAARSENASPDWLREAGAAAVDELGEHLDEPESLERVSGNRAVPFRERPADSRARGGRWGTGPIVAVGVSSAVAVAASVALFVRPPLDGGPRVGERSGGPSAELFCAPAGSAPTPLGSVGSSCPAGAELVVKATPSAEQRLPFLTVVGCSGNRCEIASQSRFEGQKALTVAGPLVEAGKRLEVIVIASDREPTEASILEAAKKRVLRANVPVLSLPPSWAQIGFVVEVANGTLR